MGSSSVLGLEYMCVRPPTAKKSIEAQPASARFPHPMFAWRAPSEREETGGNRLRDAGA